MPLTLTHTPVLLPSVLDVLKPKAGESVLDVTVGLGGHAVAFIECVGHSGSLTGLDADPENLNSARQRLSSRGIATCIHANFRDLPSLHLSQFDVIFADLGLSSPHIDDPQRGFTFREDVPLDLRFDRSRGVPAAVWLQRITERDLIRALSEYGELPGARRLAEQLKATDVSTTHILKRVAESVYGWRAPSLLPQVFQALRIAVNDELGALDCLLAVGPTLLKTGGRMGVIGYHSLEDRRVKRAFRSLTTAPKDPESGQDAASPAFELLTHKAIIPSSEEVKNNPRSRSAKFRAIRKLTTQA